MSDLQIAGLQVLGTIIALLWLGIWLERRWAKRHTGLPPPSPACDRFNKDYKGLLPTERK